jgi:Domain of unknown function (DUF4391)
MSVFISPQAVDYISFPPKSAFGGSVPKNKIYERAKASTALKQLFTQQVEKITWAYKLAPETINLPAGNFVKEIQVFDIQLKKNIDQIDENILRAIDKTIRHPLLFQIRKETQQHFCMAWYMAWKRPHESDTNNWVVEDYFASGWSNNKTKTVNLPQALNLEKLYENLLKRLMPVPLTQNETLVQQIARLQQIALLQKQAAKLENNLHKEKQFNRKVEINAELREVKQQLKGLRP